MDYSQHLKTAIFAAQEAQKIILDVYKNNFEVQLKSDQSVVTIADINSDRIIRSILMNEFPEYGILSEETQDDKQRLSKEYCWIVDPLDGTKDFVNRTNEFSINIALAYQHKVVLGLIAVPCLNVIYYAIEGQGTYKLENGKLTKLKVSNCKENLRLLISNFFFKDDELDKIPNRCLIGSVTKCGSSYKVGKIVDELGDLCVKFDSHTKEWDTAPSEIIIREAGGYMCDIYGNEITYNREDVVNHNGFIISNIKENALKFIVK